MPKYSNELAALGLTLPIACPLATNTLVTPAGVMAGLVGQVPATTASAGKNRPLVAPATLGLWYRFTSAGAATVQLAVTGYRNGAAATAILSAASAALGAADYDLEVQVTNTVGGFSFVGNFYLVTAGVRAAATATTTASFTVGSIEDFSLALRPAVATLSVTAGQLTALTT